MALNSSPQATGYSPFQHVAKGMTRRYQNSAVRPSYREDFRHAR
jgi:hypothetical protein